MGAGWTWNRKSWSCSAYNIKYITSALVGTCSLRPLAAVAFALMGYSLMAVTVLAAAAAIWVLVACQAPAKAVIPFSLYHPPVSMPCD